MSDQEIAPHEDVMRAVQEVSSKAEELERVAGYLGDEAREIRRLAGGSWDMDIPQVIIDGFNEACSDLADLIQSTHGLWNDGVNIKNKIS